MIHERAVMAHAAEMDCRAPNWFEAGVISLTAFVLATGTTALVLAWWRLYHCVPAVLVGAAAAIFVGRHEFGRHPEAGPRRAVVLATHGALLLAALFVAAMSVAPSEHVYVDRDPAVYNNTAVWLSTNHSVIVDDGPEAFRADDLHPESAGSYVGDRGLEFQFNHFTGSFLAVVLDVAGSGAMFRTSAAVTGLGLLAAFAVAMRCLRRPAAGLLVVASLACLMPFVAIARDSYSEPYAMSFLWAGALVLMRCRDRWSSASAVLGGGLLGGVCIVRVDGAVYLIPALVLIAFVFRRDGRRRSSWVMAGIAASGVVSVVDLWVFGTGYLHWLSDEIRPLVATLALSALVAAGGPPIAARWRAAITRFDRARLANYSAAVAVVFVSACWLLRPHLGTARVSFAQYLVEPLQLGEGVRVDPSRTYAEQSLARVGWYLGAVGLALAIVGIGLVVREIVRAGGRTQLTVVGAALVGGALYLWRPSINPDHVWATRRLVPALYPALAMCTAIAVDRVTTVVARRWSWTARLALWSIVALAVLAPAISATWPVREQREQYSFPSVISQACALIGDHAAVVVLGPESGDRIPITLRSWCDVPVVMLDNEIATPERLVVLQSETAAEGYRLVAVTSDAAAAGPFAQALRNGQATDVAVNERQLRKTIERRPDAYDVERLQLWVFEVSAV